MQYSQSPDTVLHALTGNRMHQDTAAVTSQITAKDINQLTWSLMEVIKDQGIGAAAFDPATPDTFQRVLQAIKKMVDTRSAAPTVIDRTGITATLLLDRFDVIHQYRSDRALMGAGVLPIINVTTGLVPGAVYQLILMSAASAALRDFVLSLRPNGTSYSNQFVMRGHVTDGTQASPTATASVDSKFSFDTFGGTSGSDGVAELLIFPAITGHYKKVISRNGDTAGFGSNVGVWTSVSNAWSVLGSLQPYAEIVNASQDYSIDIKVRRIA
jgi:hypothetical protein